MSTKKQTQLQKMYHQMLQPGVQVKNKEGNEIFRYLLYKKRKD
jgi:hypothetical protein